MFTAQSVFIAAMWVISFLGLGNSYHQLFVAAIASIILAIFAMFLPATKAIDKKMKLKQKKQHLVFLIFSVFCTYLKRKMSLFSYSSQHC
ncbi:hypothetical protein PROPEN_00311 [Proteus penneri ATCC 35198]|nr:hypothetical protein PROPEN_00311 [Proteus penneri ATCC 35198]